jgi:hypothetical protein
VMASTTLSACSLVQRLDRDLRQEVHGVFGAAGDSVTLLTPVTLTGDGRPCTPAAVRRHDLVESGLMMAMTIFMVSIPAWARTTDRADNGSVAGSCSRGCRSENSNQANCHGWP